MNRKENSKMIVIEGNIGSGKSTLLKLINDKLCEKIQTVKEPVTQWQAINGNPELNLLGAFYKDPKRWAYTFQSYAYYSRLRQWTEMDISSDITIAERSVLSDKYIFAMNGKKSGLFTELEWQLYLEYFDWLVSKFHADKIQGIIYVRTEPEVCSQRINKRGREEEQDSIPLEYLRSVHDRHEEWLMQNYTHEKIINNSSENLVDLNNSNTNNNNNNNTNNNNSASKSTNSETSENTSDNSSENGEEIKISSSADSLKQQQQEHQYPMLIIDGAQDFEKDSEVRQKICDQIQQFVDSL